jgi:peptide/nickel transport system substrate-binding protein
MKKTSTILTILSILFIFSLVLAGCSNSSTTPASSTSTVTTASIAKPTQTSTTPQPKSGGTFKFADSRGPGTTLGYFFETGAQNGMWSAPVFETVMTVDVNNNISPKLATSWEVSDDLKTVTIHLRQGVKFHDGSDFNADVAKWNFEQLMAAKVSYSIQGITSIDKIDDYTIRMNLSRYQNTFLGSISSYSMTSKAAFDAKGKEGVRWNPVGTGPFKFESFQRDVNIKFVKNKDYWQKGKPYLDAIEMAFVSDPMTMANSLQAGEFDAFGGDLTSIHYDLLQKGYNVEKYYAGAYCLLPDSKNTDSPWNNLKVRQALEYAVDRNSLVKTRGFGFWTAINQFAVPNTPSYIADLPTRSYDPAKAKQLLTEAGYPNGFKTKIIADVASTDRDAITAVQAYLKAVGIDAELNIIDNAGYGNYRSKGWNNGIMAGMVGWGSNISSSMDTYFSQNGTFFPSLIKSDEYQTLHLASLASKNYDPELAKKEVRYLSDNAIVAPLWAGSRGDIMQKYVKDTGMYTQSSWVWWDPANTWLNK